MKKFYLFVFLVSLLSFLNFNVSNAEIKRDLALGSKGDDVKELQQFLGVEQSGAFDSVTKDAVISWQKENNISPATGYFGSISRKFMRVASMTSSYSLSRLLDYKDDEVMFSQGKFGDVKNYICNINDFSCKNTDSAYFPLPAIADTLNLPTEQEILYKKLSLSQHYEFVAVKIKDGDSYKINFALYKLSSDEKKWDLVKDNLNIGVGDDIAQVVFSDNTENKIVIIGSGTKQKITFFDLEQNKVMASTVTEDRILSPKYSSTGESFAYYVPGSTSVGGSKEKKFVLLNAQNSTVSRSEFKYSVAKNWELLTDAYNYHSISPSGNSYAFIEDSVDYPEPRFLDLTKSKDVNSATNIKWDDLGQVSDIMAYSDDIVLIVSNSKSRPYDWSLYQVDVKTGTHVEIVKNISILYEMKRMSNGKIFLETLDGPNMKPILYDPISKETSSFPSFSWTERLNDNTREVLHFSNGAYGVLNSPNTTTFSNSKNLPIIVWLHGGPYRQVALDFHHYPSYATYDWTLDQAVTSGSYVLKLDYPGSYGYGNTYTYSILKNAGSIEVDSIMSNIREFKKKNNLTGDVYVVGNSYGGYLAAKLIVDYPKEIKGAVPINGVYEWRTLLKYIGNSIFNVYFDGLYMPLNASTTLFYDKASITKNIPNLTKNNKMEVVVATKDSTISTDQAYTFSELLGLQKKNYGLVLLEGDDHILTKKESNEKLCKTVFDFIGLTLSNKS